MPQATFEDHNNRVFELRAEANSSLYLFYSEGAGVMPDALKGKYTAPKFAQETWDIYLKTSVIEKSYMRLKRTKI